MLSAIASITTLIRLKTCGGRQVVELAAAAALAEHWQRHQLQLRRRRWLQQQLQWQRHQRLQTARGQGHKPGQVICRCTGHAARQVHTDGARSLNPTTAGCHFTAKPPQASLRELQPGSAPAPSSPGAHLRLRVQLARLAQQLAEQPHGVPHHLGKLRLLKAPVRHQQVQRGHARQRHEPAAGEASVLS
jgi:hypothetical protein